MINLDSIAEDLFNKIRGRYPKITIGDEASVITNDPKEARFFDFEFMPGKKINISLDEKALTVMFSNKLFDSSEETVKSGWYNFLKELREFAKKRLLNFDTRDINKNNLDKRDYDYLAKSRTEERTMSESKMYGTSRTSYQDIGNARLVVKHNAPVNQELPTGRTQQIHSIYVESESGERFRYPYRHLNGARALARHVSEGGNLYDEFGEHIVSLSEELSKLRKFKTYMNRSSVMAEGLSGYMDIVNERIEEVKDRVHQLQKESFYKRTIENFVKLDLEEVPEEIQTDWVDQLTIKQFNEELKGVFPYIYKLVSEKKAIKEIGIEDLLGEMQAEPAKCDHCDGTGKHGEDDCEECGGTGFVREASGYEGGEEARKHEIKLAGDMDQESGITDAMAKEIEDNLAEKGIDAQVEPSENDFASVIVHTMKSKEAVMDALDKSGIGVDEEIIDPETNFEKHLDSIVAGAKHEQVPEEDLGDTDYEGSMDYEFTGDDGEMANGTLHYKVIDGKVDPNSLRGESEYEGNAKVDDEFATDMVKPGGADHEEALKAAQEDYDYESDRMRSKFEGNEFAQKVRDLKAKGAKPGTKFKTSDGEEHTLEDAIKLAGLAVEDFWTEDELVAEGGNAFDLAVTYAKEIISNSMDDKEALEKLQNLHDSEDDSYAQKIYKDYMADIEQKGLSKVQAQVDQEDYEPDFPEEEEKEGLDPSKPKTPLSDFILSHFDRENGTFPKGETAVLTMVEKDYGDEFVEPAQKFITKICGKYQEMQEPQKNSELDRLRNLAGLSS